MFEDLRDLFEVNKGEFIDDAIGTIILIIIGISVGFFFYSFWIGLISCCILIIIKRLFSPLTKKLKNKLKN